MISISTTTPATPGNVIFKEDIGQTKLRDRTSRVSRTGTLDGSCVLTCSGVTDSDRTFTIHAQLSESIADDLESIFEDQTEVILSCRVGSFLGAIEKLNISNGELKMTFLVKEKLSS